MAEERELTIRIKGALTPEAFSQAREELKKLGLEVDTTSSKGKSLDTAFTSAGKSLERQFGLTGGAAGLLERAITGLVGAFTVGAITSFVASIARSASQLNDLANTTRFSIQMLQSLQGATEQVDGSLDGVASGLENLQQRLGQGDAGATGAIRRLGLNFKQFIDEAPDDQIRDLAQAFASIEDPQKRAALAAELFGKSWKQMLPTLMELANDASGGVVHMSDASVKALDSLGDAWTRFILSVKNAAGEELGQVAEQVNQLLGLMRLTQALSPDMFAAADRETRTIKDQIAGMTRGAEAARTYGKSVDLLALSARSVDYAEQGMRESIADSQKQMREAADAAKKLAEEEGKASDARRKAVEEFRSQTVIFAGTGAAEHSVIATGIDIKDQLVKPYQSLEVVIGSVKSGVDDLIHDGLTNLAPALKPPVDQWKDFKATIADIGPTMARAFEGGGNMGGALRSIGAQFSGQLGNKLGGSLAKSLGMSAAGIGASIAMGAATFGISAGVQGAIMLAQHSKNATKKDREEFAKQMGFGDLGALYTDLQKLGEQGEHLADIGMHVVGKHDQAANEQWMKEVAQFYDDIKKQQDDVRQSLGDLDQQFADLGASAPDDLDAVIDSLLKAGKTKEAQQGMNDLTAAVKKYQDQVAETEAFKTIEQEMKDVGLTADDMNAKFKQGADEEAARQIAKQFNDLLPYVKDANVLAAKFGDQLNQMIADAQTTGIAIPESMRPILQSLIDQGKLIGANGEKLTDLAGINFEEDPLQKGLDELNATLKDVDETLHKMVDGLDAVGDHGEDAARRTKRAFDDLPSEVDINVRPHFEGMRFVPGADLEDIPTADTPLRAVRRSGLVNVNPGDIVGMPHLGGLGGPSITFNVTVNGSGGDGRRLSDDIVTGINVAISQGRIQGIQTMRGPYG